MSNAIMQQALDFCLFCWRDVDMNDYAFERLETTIEALRTELAKPYSEPDPVTWKPIKTAPKDATRILVCRAIDADGKPISDDAFGLFVQRAAWWEGEGWIVYISMIREPICFFEPTHWMPIPPAPKETP